MKKRLTVNFDRPANEDIAFVYKIKPYVADNDRHAAFVKTECENGAAVFYNPSNTDYKGFCAVYSDAAATAQTNGSEITLKVSAAHTDGCFSFYMAFAATRRGLNAVRTLPFAEPGEKKADFHTGIPRLDDFASALLLHQAHDTRVLARTGFYQCSGAYGFRDQLQDTMNLCEFYPKRAEYQLLRCAAAQFPEGDVLHWFHAVPFPSPCLKGVRTRCSDDLLWLPLAVAVYIQTTGDVDILNKSIPFLTGEPLAKDEKERYAAFFKGAVRASLYTHCLRAIEAASATGDRGLPLIRGGDWNDAFGSVGENERGESVWLAMFLRLVCSRFSEICVLFGDVETAAQLRKTATEMEDAVLKNAFNGRYFLRGYYDDGTVLGGEESDADKIDLLVQAFASLSDTGNRVIRPCAQRMKRCTTGRKELFACFLLRSVRIPGAPDTSTITRRACGKTAGNTPMRRSGLPKPCTKKACPTRRALFLRPSCRTNPQPKKRSVFATSHMPCRRTYATAGGFPARAAGACIPALRACWLRLPNGCRTAITKSHKKAKEICRNNLIYSS